VRLLIVSNEEEVRCTLPNVVRDNGHPSPLLAKTCREALGLHDLEWPAEADLPIDVVLVDLDLLDHEGLETCHRLRESPRMKDVPLLALSSLPPAQAYALARSVSALDFIRKPVEVPELLGRLHSACEHKRQLDKCRADTCELERLNGELHKLCVLDELTGIANRRFFNLVVTQEWARAVREVVPFSIIMIDIDFFKDYNDLYGHQKGDACLRQVAGALSAVVRRPGDYVIRYGGEEFVVVLSHTGLRGALAVAEHLRSSVEGLNMEHGRSSVHDRVTISLGVASTQPARSDSLNALIEGADQAIYEAKREGRNRVRAFSAVSPYLHAPHPEPCRHGGKAESGPDFQGPAGGRAVIRRSQYELAPETGRRDGHGDSAER